MINVIYLLCLLDLQQLLSEAPQLHSRLQLYTVNIGFTTFQDRQYPYNNANNAIISYIYPKKILPSGSGYYHLYWKVSLLTCVLVLSPHQRTLLYHSSYWQILRSFV